MSELKNRLLAALLALVILVPAWTIWRESRAFVDFTQYFGRVSEVMQESAAKKKLAINANYREGVERLNKEMAARLELTYKAPAGSDENMDIAVAITRALFEDLFRSRLEFAAAIAPLFSERMQDRNTVKNKESLEWRIGVLEKIDIYALGQQARLERIVDKFRQEVATSGLPRKYKEFVWQIWAYRLNVRLAALGPEVESFQREIDGYRRLFDYLYEYSDMYYVSEDGRIIITNDRHIKEYQSIARAVGQEW